MSRNAVAGICHCPKPDPVPYVDEVPMIGGRRMPVTRYSRDCGRCRKRIVQRPDWSPPRSIPGFRHQGAARG
jgi:hypothetical protein